MTPAQTRLLAEHACAAIAAGAGISGETLRSARDDATAPHAEIPAAALRRLWLWGVASVAPSIFGAAVAAGVSRPSVRRAVAAVDAWAERDNVVAEATLAIGELIDGLARVITEGPAILEAVTLQAIADRRELERRRKRQAAPRARAMRARDLHRVQQVNARL